MKNDWKMYDYILGEGSNAREAAIYGAVSSFLRGIVDDPAYQDDATVNGVITPMAASRKSSLECSIKLSPEEDINIGDMVECLGETWLVVELYIDKVGMRCGVMWLCNTSINFQTGKDGRIYTKKCVVDDGTYSKKSSDPDVFSLANTYKVYMTIDEQTKKMYVDKRIAFGKIFSSDGTEILEVYKVVGIDLKSKNFGSGSHLMVMTMQRDVYNQQTDSIEKNICDVFAQNDTSVKPSNNGKTCEIIGRDVVRIGTSRTFTADFKSNESNGVTPVAKWVVTANEKIKITQDGNTISVSVPLDASLVGEIILIKASDVGTEYAECEKKVQVITVG